ncbi:MAG: hypothetical protein Q4P34_02385 [Tissierellia bacterium]|nr:hypothetical protein [Tissierellia bacterium]
MEKIKKYLKNNSKYLIIFAFIAIGVSLFYGMSISGGLMRKTADDYLRKFDLEDIKIVSSHGIDEDDMEIINQIEDMDTIYVGYQMDVNIDETKNLISVESIPESWVKYELKEGSYPKNPGEIAVDSSIQDFPYKLGDEITLHHKGDNPTLRLKRNKFKIVGTISSPEYILKSEKGVSSLTGSKLDGYALIVPEDFDLLNPNFARIHLNSTRKISPFTSEYRAIVDNTTFELREAFKDMPEKKAIKVKEMAKRRIEDSESEIKDLNKELKTAEDKLNKQKTALNKEKKIYTDKKKEYDDLLVKSKRDLEHGESNIKTSEEKIKSIENSYNEAKQNYEAQSQHCADLNETVSNKRTYVDGQRAYLDELQANLDSEIANVNSRIRENDREVNSLKRSLSTLKVQLKILSYKKTEILNKIRDVEGSISRLGSEKTYLNSKLDDFNSQQANINAQYSELNPEIDELNSLESEYEAENEKLAANEESMNNLKTDLDNSVLELDKIKKDYEKAKQFMEKDKSKMEASVNALEEKLNKNTALFEKDADDYDNLLKNSKAEIKNKEDIIKRSKEELSGDIVPTYLVTNSGENSGMKLYYNITKRVDMITLIFPILFFIIVLVSIYIFSASIVSESNIGFLKTKEEKIESCLHYFKNISIYSAAGIITGILIGTFAIANNIFLIYGENFSFKTPKLSLFPIQTLIVCAGVFAFILLGIYSAFRSDKKVSKESFLDKEIWLEKYPSFWNKKSIVQKACLKNLFANPIRILLIVLGTTAFTALLLLGIGLRRSIEDIPRKQYENIMTYDANISMSKGENKNENGEYDYFLREIKYARKIEDLSYKNARTISEGMPSIDFKLFIPKDSQGLEGIIKLRSPEDAKAVHLHPNAAIISKKLADLQGISDGDTISFTIGTDKYEFVVSKVFENYVGNYVFVSPEYFKEVTGMEPEMNSKMVVLKDNSSYAIENFVNESARYDSVQSIQTNRSEKQTTASIVKPLVYIAYIYIFFTIALLYITIRFTTGLEVKTRLAELIGELNNPEDTQIYLKEIFKENFISILFGVIIGILFGVALFLSAVSDTVPDNIKLIPYLESIDIFMVISIILILAWFSQVLVHSKIEKQQMKKTESQIN